MTVATEIIQNYRLALRSLWNLHYWRSEGFRDWESVRDFNKLCPILFWGLVTRRLEPLAERPDPEQPIFGSAFRVVPSLQRGEIPTMMVNTRNDGVWENLQGPFANDQLKLILVDFFDWSVMNWRDFRYYKVRILDFHGRPELIKREALIEVLDADVLWNVHE